MASIAHVMVILRYLTSLPPFDSTPIQSLPLLSGFILIFSASINLHYLTPCASYTSLHRAQLTHHRPTPDRPRLMQDGRCEMPLGMLISLSPVGSVISGGAVTGRAWFSGGSVAVVEIDLTFRGSSGSMGRRHGRHVRRGFAGSRVAVRWWRSGGRLRGHCALDRYLLDSGVPPSPACKDAGTFLAGGSLGQGF